ncbi:MAG: hypothetical protein H6747_08995 [Deltaproteobacteria bacterium]|nr:hypothetical protein [Deltaproteobacteria bacterium]
MRETPRKAKSEKAARQKKPEPRLNELVIVEFVEVAPPRRKPKKLIPHDELMKELGL